MCNKNCLSFGQNFIKQEDIVGKRIIEVGSHDINGSFRTIITPMLPSEYIGVDTAPGKGVDIICTAEGVVNMFGVNSFDVVISTEALEHIEDWKLVFSNLKWLCRPKGLIFITTRSIGFEYHGFPMDYWRFEASDMREIFSDCTIEAMERDMSLPGIFVKVRKPENFKENLLTGGLFSIVHNTRTR